MSREDTVLGGWEMTACITDKCVVCIWQTVTGVTEKTSNLEEYLTCSIGRGDFDSNIEIMSCY